MAERGADTRSRIQAVALELFAEQGYDKTSLREIAERLGVTKAALYYHFRTKDDIVASLFVDFGADVDEIVRWAREHDMTDETRAEVVRRYAKVLGESGSMIIAFVQGNRTSMRDIDASKELFERFHTLATLLADPKAPLKKRLKQNMALHMLHIGYAGVFELNATVEESRAAALEVALELLAGT